jgi:rfaE bifunctional protein nucleotidyltransferase chain/domain
MSNKIVNALELANTIKQIRSSTKSLSVVLCHGVFDLVHPGHLEHFQEAKKFGDTLVVSLTADSFVHKGPNRPYFDQIRRAEFLSALEIVDYVYIVEGESALDAINLVKPDVYVKGPDYRILQDDITGKIEIEKIAVEKYGGKLVFTSGFTSSSTKLINSALIPQDSEVRTWVNEFRGQFSIADVIHWIDKLSTIDVAVLGEIIIDVYTDCKPLSKSSKDPILAFQRFNTQKFLGGVLAIADSCSKWSNHTAVYSACGNDFEEHFSTFTNFGHYELNLLELKDRPTIVKHRFVDINSGNRVFEFYDYNPENLEIDLQLKVIEAIRSKLNSHSLLLLADYGHGFFGDNLIKELCSSSAFLCVNTQSNAGNRGFNTFSKYPRIDFLSLNGGELELELRKKNIDYEVIVPEIMEKNNCKYAIVTLGGDGLLTFDSSGQATRTPALASKVIDKVGAGDSVLAIASMLAYLGAPREIIGMLSSVVAAFEVSQMGHKESMSIVSMKKFVIGILG